MAKIVVSFDSYYSLDGYDARQALSQIRSIPGLKSLKAYRATEGSPAYTVEIEVDDEQLDELQKRLDGYMAPYAGYLSNRSVRVLKELSV